MGLLDRLFGGRVRAEEQPNPKRDPTDDRWWAYGGGMTAAGVVVTLDKALTVPVVFDCTQVLQQSAGALPWAMFERLPDGSKKAVPTHPLARVLENPNPETTTTELFGQIVFDLATAGDAFHLIVPGDFGPISELWRLDPGRTTVERASDRSRRFRYVDDAGRTEVYPEDRIWHIRKLPLRGGLRGTSTVETGREEIGVAIALRDFANRFFANNATPPFVIHVPQTFKTKEDRENFVGAWRRWFGGRNRHSPGVAEGGAKVEKIGVNNEEAQFLETRKQIDYTLAQLWRMPPHKVGLLERATNNNIEHQGLEFVTDTLMPYLDLIETSIEKELILNPGRFLFEFNVAGLLRGDQKARFDAYALGRQWGWLSVNDIRRLENMNPIAGGDAYLTPLNMGVVGQPAPREAAAQIFGPRGEVVSRIVGGNVVRLQEYRHAA